MARPAANVDLKFADEERLLCRCFGKAEAVKTADAYSWAKHRPEGRF